jgi:putative transposase
VVSAANRIISITEPAPMTAYRRPRLAGGCYFFTLALADRSGALLVQHIEHLRSCVRHVKARHPFTIEAMVVLPDHLHCIWTLPENDADYSTRWNLIKSAFSRGIAAGERRSNSRIQRQERGIWQRRFWEHMIRDEQDYANHVAYIHINPVKHGYVARAVDWACSSIHQHIRDGRCDAAWTAESFILELEFE